MPGSAGRPDGLCPQHLKYLASESTGDAGPKLDARLTEVADLCLTGRFPVNI